MEQSKEGEDKVRLNGDVHQMHVPIFMHSSQVMHIEISAMIMVEDT